MRYYALAVLALGLVSLALTHAPGPIPLLVGLVALYAEVRSHYIPGYGALNFAEGLYLGVAILHGPTSASLLAAGVGLAADHYHRKAPSTRLFNLGWALTTFSWCGFVHHPLLALVAYGVWSSVLQAGAQALMEGLPLRATLAHQRRLLTLSLPSAGFLALLLTWGLNPLLVLFPVEILSAYTRLREAHQELQATQARLVAAERQAGLVVLAAGVAHEINNPLQAVHTSLFMLRRDPGDRESLALAQAGVDRARDVVARMLTYSRPAPSGSPGRVETAVQDALAFLVHRQGALEVQLPALPEVACSPTELVQIFSNLLSNALDAGQNVKVEGGVGPGTVWVRVSDDGPGVAHPEKIFDPFFTTKPVGSGTGLGLAIVAGIVKSCQGSIRLEPGSPTSFLLTLPQVSSR